MHQKVCDNQRDHPSVFELIKIIIIGKNKTCKEMSSCVNCDFELWACPDQKSPFRFFNFTVFTLCAEFDCQQNFVSFTVRLNNEIIFPIIEKKFQELFWPWCCKLHPFGYKPYFSSVLKYFQISLFSWFLINLFCFK